jgi:predicted glycosyltransferase
VIVPPRAVDAVSLLALADVFVGGGGTMTREAALLGTPTATVFAGELAAVDAELIRRGLLVDLRRPGTLPRFEKKTPNRSTATREAAEALADAIVEAVRSASRRG